MHHSLRHLARCLGLLAHRCPVCGKVRNHDDAPLCPACATELVLRTGGFCPTCGDLSGDTTAPPTVCGQCRLDPPPWSALSFFGEYDTTLRHLILGYKFNNNFGRSKLLGELALQAYNRDAHPFPDLIVPVPLHKRRLMKRGFNQSSEIARFLATALAVPMSNEALARIRNTAPQTKLGHRERQTNIKGAFQGDSDLVRGKRVLLTDDVYTTGATLKECARTLKNAGAKEITVLVLARARRD